MMHGDSLDKRGTFVEHLNASIVRLPRNFRESGVATEHRPAKYSASSTLQTCMDKFSDAYYLNGCSVGGLSRLFMASWYQQNGKASAAKKVIEEIGKSYADAQDQSGNIIGDLAAGLEKK